MVKRQPEICKRSRFSEPLITQFVLFACLMVGAGPVMYAQSWVVLASSLDQDQVPSPPTGNQQEESLGEQVKKLQEKVDFLLKMVAEQQSQIEELKRVRQTVDSSPRSKVVPDSAMKAETASVPRQSLNQREDQENQKILRTLRGLSSKFVLFGDLRERWQSDVNRRDGQPARNRARTRLRLGFNYNISDDFQFGVRIRTGNPDDPRSPHQSFGNVYHSWAFALDRAYLKFKPSFLPPNRLVSVSVGKFPNALLTTEGLWDDDVNPEGIAGEFGFSKLHGLDEVKIIGAQYIVDERNLGRDATMTGAQVQLKKSVVAGSSVTLAVGLYDYHQLGSIATSASDRRENLVRGQTFASQFRVFDSILKGDFALKGIPLSPYINFFHNTRAFDSRSNGAWAGLSLGAPKKQGDWGITYLYGYIERDATLAAFAQDDFLAGTNYQGHRIQFLYNLLDRLQLKPEVYTTRLLTVPSGTHRKTEFTFRLNTEIRF